LPTGSNPPPAGTLALDAQGRLYIADTLNHRIRRVDFDADRIETVVGDGEPRFSGDGGPATEASIHNPRDLAIGPDGRLYIADELNDRVRAVDLDTGIITTVMGTGQRGQGEDGLDPLETDLAQPVGVAFDADGRLYVADMLNNVIRRVAPQEEAR
jgi:sugar lactone lactonase YvrE